MNQSLGLVHALQRGMAEQPSLQSACIDYEIVEPLNVVQSALLYLGLSKAPDSWPEHCDVLIAAGHACHSSLIAAKKHYKAKSVLLMKPSLPLSCFDVCIVPAHDEVAKADNVIVTEGALNPVVYGGEKKHLNMMLIGGPSKHFHWDDKQVLLQIKQQLEKQAEVSKDWLLISSRRTPDSFYQLLHQEELPLTLLKPDDVEAGWLATQFPFANECWVSPDSVSMVYEALTAEAKVSVFSLQECEPTTRVAKGIRGLIEAGRVNELDKPQGFPGGQSHNPELSQKPFNQADMVARALLDQYSIFDRVVLR